MASRCWQRSTGYGFYLSLVNLMSRPPGMPIRAILSGTRVMWNPIHHRRETRLSMTIEKYGFR